MLNSLWEEFHFFNNYPVKQLTISAALFGTIIQQRCVCAPSLTRPALRGHYQSPPLVLLRKLFASGSHLAATYQGVTTTLTTYHASMMHKPRLATVQDAEACR